MALAATQTPTWQPYWTTGHDFQGARNIEFSTAYPWKVKLNEIDDFLICFALLTRSHAVTSARKFELMAGDGTHVRRYVNKWAAYLFKISKSKVSPVPRYHWRLDPNSVNAAAQVLLAALCIGPVTGRNGWDQNLRMHSFGWYIYMAYIAFLSSTSNFLQKNIVGGGFPYCYI